MILEPIISEKSLALAKLGKYTFKVDKRLNKYQIRKLIEETFKVHVIAINTITRRAEVTKTVYRKKKLAKGYKKAIVALKEKEKIDLFEEKGKK